MAVHHPGLKMELGDLQAMIRRMVVQTFQNAAIGSAGMRVYDGGWITIENGGLSVTGQATVTGQLGGSGTLDWAGPWFLKGLGSISGNVDISGLLSVTGAATFGNSIDVLNRLTLGPSGYIESGTVRIDRLGSYGGRVVSSGSVLYLDAVSNVVIGAPFFTAYDGSVSNLSVVDTLTATTKLFRVLHPTKPDHYLQHGATESPVSGVEYWGEETLPESGELTVALPEYFDALTKQENRAVMVTARGFVADWGDIENGSFTVTGTPGGRFSWLVKAERKGADFAVEELVHGPLREAD